MDGNNWGNSNGLVPSFTDVDISRSDTRQGGWFGRAVASVLPSHHINRLGLSRRPPVGFGGGLSNDGVFANMMAKPERPRLTQQGIIICDIWHSLLTHFQVMIVSTLHLR
jgi:hypothetical protein